MRPERKARAPSGAWRSGFLAAFRDSGIVRWSCAAAGIEHSTFYKALKGEPEFRAQYELAKKDVADLVKARALEGCTLGFERPVFYRGKLVETVREVSVPLLIFMLQKLAPEEFGDRREEAEQERSKAPETATWDLSKLSRQELDALEAMAERAVVAPPPERSDWQSPTEGS